MDKQDIKQLIIMILVAVALVLFFAGVLWLGLKLNVEREDLNCDQFCMCSLFDKIFSGVRK